MYPKAEGGLVKAEGGLLNLPRLEGHLITISNRKAMLLLSNIIVTETIRTLLGDLTIAEME